MKKIENDPNLKQQEKILDHHPHTPHMPPHGSIRKMKAWHAEKVHRPTHEKKTL
ncbi:MAG: hypothetical protein ACYCOU_03670 [Sulfobacillus sp.]